MDVFLLFDVQKPVKKHKKYLIKNFEDIEFFMRHTTVLESQSVPCGRRNLFFL